MVHERSEAQGELFCRCLFPSPRWCFDHVEPEVQVMWDKVPPEWRFSGHVFVGGSAFHTTMSGISRAGFSSVQIDRAGQVAAVIVPLSQAPSQQARDGEDMVFAFLATHCTWDPATPCMCIAIVLRRSRVLRIQV